ADEPTGNLDSENSRAIHDLFGQCVAEGRSVVVVTHETDGHDRYSRRLEIHDGIVHEASDHA
ncbi:MAG: ABC transporter ATP-binding protein, partial [Acidobacteriota bacterium]